MYCEFDVDECVGMCEYECFVWYVGCSGCVFDVLVGVML